MTPRIETVPLSRIKNLRGRDITPIPIENGTRYLIPLTRGLFAKIDACDLSKVLGISWVAHKGARGNMYARAYIRQLESGKCVFAYMHRLIMQKSDPAAEVDHANRNDTLNNTRDNLRIADHGQQQCNAERSKAMSGYRGVVRERGCIHYCGYVKRNGIRYSSRGHKTAESAARARDRLALLHHGEFATLNFPRSEYKSE